MSRIASEIVFVGVYFDVFDLVQPVMWCGLHRWVVAAGHGGLVVGYLFEYVARLLGGVCIRNRVSDLFFSHDVGDTRHGRQKTRRVLRAEA